MDPLYRLLRPILFGMDAEGVHQAAVRAGAALGSCPLACDVVERALCVRDARLHVHAFGRRFPSPMGLAAGFDKNALLIDAAAALGFGFVEVGTVTPRPWRGNPRPRLFRLPEDGAILNRMGLNNHGATVVAERWRAARRTIPVGISLGRVNDGGDAITDFVDVARMVDGAGDFLVLNIHCPNAEHGKTFEDPPALRRLLEALQGAGVLEGLPWLLKMSPDVPPIQLLSLVDNAREFDVRGFVLTNTTTRRDVLRMPAEALGRGGISGRPVADLAMATLRLVYKHVGGQLPLIGVGGIFSALDAYARIRAGATLLQAYTGFVYGGPTFARDINAGLLHLLNADGLASVTEAVGADA